MDAFKKYGVAHIQDLRVELMYNYVHQDLIPKLLQKAQQNGLYNNDGDEDCNDAPVGVDAPIATATADNDNEELGGVTPTIVPACLKKDLFLRVYGLRKLGITTIAKWMHAVGFQYKKREKHYFVDGHEKLETLAYPPVFKKKVPRQ